MLHQLCTYLFDRDHPVSAGVGHDSVGGPIIHLVLWTYIPGSVSSETHYVVCTMCI